MTDAHPYTDDTVSVPEAAERLGVSERTIRRRIKDGEIRATSVETPQGHIWRIDPASLPVHPALSPGGVERRPADATRHTGQEDGTAQQGSESTRRASDAARQAADMPPGTPELMKMLEIVEEDRRLIDRLQRDNQQLAGQLGFVQAQLQQAQERIKLLEAPKDEPEPAREPEPTPVQRAPWWKRLFS